MSEVIDFPTRARRSLGDVIAVVLVDNGGFVMEAGYCGGPPDFGFVGAVNKTNVNHRIIDAVRLILACQDPCKDELEDALNELERTVEYCRSLVPRGALME